MSCFDGELFSSSYLTLVVPILPWWEKSENPYYLRITQLNPEAFLLLERPWISAVHLSPKQSLFHSGHEALVQMWNPSILQRRHPLTLFLDGLPSGVLRTFDKTFGMCAQSCWRCWYDLPPWLLWHFLVAKEWLQWWGRQPRTRSLYSDSSPSLQESLKFRFQRSRKSNWLCMWFRSFFLLWNYCCYWCILKT